MVMVKKSVKFPAEIIAIIENIAKKEGSTFGDVVRRLCAEALNTEWCRQNEDMLAALIRNQIVSISGYVKGKPMPYLGWRGYLTSSGSIVLV